MRRTSASPTRFAPATRQSAFISVPVPKIWVAEDPFGGLADLASDPPRDPPRDANSFNRAMESGLPADHLAFRKRPRSPRS
jgi:hypothetical protein